MALCEMDGIARISEDSIAREANVTQEEAAAALRILMSPDPFSKNPAHEGRRLEKVDGGFRLLNYLNYRKVKTAKERASYMNEYMKEYRKKKKAATPLSWQETYKNEADDAMTLPIPAEFPPDVEGAVIDFLSMRYAFATESKRKQDRVRLTAPMVKSLFEETKIALMGMTSKQVADKLRNAAISGYRAPRFGLLYQ